MSLELSAISPLAAYLGSFMNVAAPAWVLILFATTLYWIFLLFCPVFTIAYLDRKIGADIQMRIGPNRASRYGLFQILADAMKLIFKEDANPGVRDGILFRWGPVFAIVLVFTAIGTIPVGQDWVLSNLESGVIYVISALVFSKLCIFLAAYSPKSQWSALSAFRVLGLVAAYIVPLALAILPAVLVAGGGSFEQIIQIQGGMPWQWNVFHSPGTFVACIALFLSLLIWQGRVPFDHTTAEGEIAGGLIAEYSGIRKGLFTLLEYLALFLSCALVVAIYLGGWLTPFNLESFGRAANLVQCALFMAKVIALVLLSIWIRWSLPRMRIDQIVNFAWRILVPVGLAGTIMTALWSVLTKGRGFGEFL